MNKVMSAPDLVQCLAGEAYTLPELALDRLKSEPDLLALVRRYGKGLATYEEVRELFSQHV
jgi:hypothetical protein